MPIRWKLLIILLVVAIPPLVFVSWFDQRATRTLGRDLASERRQVLTDVAVAALRQAMEGQARVLAAERRLAETRLETGAGAPSAGAVDWRARAEGLSADLGEVVARIPYQALTAALELPEPWRETARRHVVDAAGRVLTDRQAGDERLPGPVVAQLGEDRIGVVRTLVAGRDSFVAYGPAGGFPVSLVVMVPAETVLADAVKAESRVRRGVERQLAISGTAVGVFALVAVLLSLIAARSITGPVKALNRAAGRIAEGDLAARAEVHTGDELEDLADSFNGMVPKLRDRLRMREALSLAMEVQQNLLPSESPAVPGFDLAGRILYCDETGGDYYDFLDLSELGGQRIGVAVGDVAGHGVAAALLMTTARALLRSRASHPGTLSQLMTDINRHLSRDAHRGRFMTLFYGVIEESSHTFRWVNAGHDPAIVYDPDTDAFDELSGEDIPLGIDPEWGYLEESRDVWRPGQVVVIGTDGIWEARDPHGEMFGRARLREVIRAHGRAPAADLCAAVADAVIAFRGGRPQHDDATVVAIRVTG